MTLQRWMGIGVAAATLGIGTAPAQATLAFLDDFESGLGKWNPAGTAQIVTDPLNAPNKVVNFSSLASGGDAFTGTVTPGVFSAGIYTLSVDILGQCTSGQCGGYIGIDVDGTPAGAERWLIGDGSFSPTNISVTNNGAWQTVSLTFDSRNYLGTSTFRLKMEDFVGSGGVAGDVYFDNMRLETVPEPASLALLGLALAALAAGRRRGSTPR